MIYEVGDIARLSVAFTDILGVPADPTTVSITVQDPTGAQFTNTVDIVHVSTGNFYYDLSITLPGQNSTNPAYIYKWAGTGAVVATQEGSIVVAPTTLVPPVPVVPAPVTFTYDFTSAPLLSTVRMLIGDTDAQNPLFTDAEVNQAIFLESSQNLYVSGQAAPTGAAVQSPSIPQVYSPYRSAALLLDSLAANKSLLSSVIQLLDVRLSVDKAAIQLRAQAECYRTTESMAGHFAIAEWVVNQFTARERIWAQLLRLYGG